MSWRSQPHPALSVLVIHCVLSATYSSRYMSPSIRGLSPNLSDLSRRHAWYSQGQIHTHFFTEPFLSSVLYTHTYMHVYYRWKLPKSPP